MLKGKIVHHVIRSSGIPLSKVAEKLGVSRSTLYNRLRTKIKDTMILEVGAIIAHDFCIEFPYLKEIKEQMEVEDRNATYYTRQQEELLALHHKYMELLEAHTKFIYYIIGLLGERDIQKVRVFLQEVFEKHKRE